MGKPTEKTAPENKSTRKAQTSTEFVIILAAVALFSVFAIGLFSHIQNTDRMVYSALGNVPVTANTAVHNGSSAIFVYSVIPNTTYVNRSNTLQVLLSYPSTYALEGLYIEDNNAVDASPSGYNSIQYMPLTTEQFSVVPLHAGAINITVTAFFSFDGNTVTEQSVSRTFAELQDQNATNSTGSGSPNGGSQPGAFSAYIVHKSESEFYPVSATVPVVTFGWWSHCSYHNFGGSLQTEPEQCGSGTWGFNTQDYQCNPFTFQDKYYCFNAKPSGYNVSQIRPNPTYLYNMTLVLSNATLLLRSKLSSNSSNAVLLDPKGVQHGYSAVNATYGSVISPIPYLSYVILGSRYSTRAINMSNYSVYYYAEQNLIDYMSAYNGTWNNGAAISLMTGTISNVGADERSLLNASSAHVQGCSALYGGRGAEGLACNAVIPFSYDINAQISGSNSVNQSLLYQGSLISVT